MTRSLRARSIGLFNKRPIGCDWRPYGDDDRGCLIWAHEGTGKDVLNLFLDEFTREQRRVIEVVTADGARWIRQLVKRRCPNARWVMGPFHVVQWMNDALDAVRCEEWNAARAARPRPAGKRGRPARGELGISNGRVEVINNKIKVAVRMGYGFRNTDNLVALLMLRCGDCQPPAPGSPVEGEEEGHEGSEEHCRLG